MPEINLTRSASVLSQSGQIENNNCNPVGPLTPKKVSIGNKNFLEGQGLSKTSMLGWEKKADEYEHYDNVVRDLLS